MATFQNMATMMKSMKPEDMITIISLVQSGKLQLQENDPGGGTENLMRQIQQERRVIDYSHGRGGDGGSGGGYLEDQLRGGRSSSGDRRNEADLRRLASAMSTPRQQNRRGRLVIYRVSQKLVHVAPIFPLCPLCPLSFITKPSMWVIL